MSTWNVSDKARQLREKQAAKLKNTTRWSSNILSGLPIRRSVIESGKRRNQSANIMRKNSAVRAIIRQMYHWLRLRGSNHANQPTQPQHYHSPF
jgi:hypothetical protein